MFRIIFLLAITFLSINSNADVYNSDKMVIVAGTIRQDVNEPSKWCWINNQYHTPTGVDASLCHIASNGKITINYGVKYKKVITFIVTADETYISQLDMRVGVSAGLELSILELTSYGVKLYPSNDLGYSSGNIWIYAVMESF